MFWTIIIIVGLVSFIIPRHLDKQNNLKRNKQKYGIID